MAKKYSRTSFGISVAAAAICCAVTSTAVSAQGVPNPRLEAQINQPFNTPFLNTAMLGSIAQTTTIVPTDIVPLPGPHEGQSFGQTFQLRLLQRLPSRFFLTAINETSFRLETNPFQDPPRASLERKLTNGLPITSFSQPQQTVINTLLGQCNKDQQVFRTLPNVTAGWEFTPKTRVFANYFLIRDSLQHSTILNATTQSVGGGLQHDFPIGRRANFQTNLQFRELFQTSQPDVFDYIPSATFTYLVKDKPNLRSIAFVNTLLQMRGLQPFCAPTRELDPFYTVGLLTQKGRWQGSVTGTFLQNFRKPFGRNALAPINNYSIICDFELDRQLFKKYSALQAFIRAEPIWNMHSGTAPGFSGFDFRLFYGLRMTVGKTALTGKILDIKQQIEDSEVQPPKPMQGGSAPLLTPLQSSWLAPRSVIH